MIGTDVDGMFGTFEIVTPVFEAFDNGEHFTIMDIVIAFCGDTLSGPKCDGVWNTISIRLGYDTRYGKSG